MTRKKKTNNFEKLVIDILDSLDTIVPKGMLAIEVIGALEAAKSTLTNRLVTAQNLQSLVNGVLNEPS
jgi:hypothetical protein